MQRASFYSISRQMTKDYLKRLCLVLGCFPTSSGETLGVFFLMLNGNACVCTSSVNTAVGVHFIQLQNVSVQCSCPNVLVKSVI